VAEQGENEEIVGYVGTITDISERKQAEITLQEREELLSSIAENIADGYAYRSVIHPDGTIEIPYISTSATKLLGNFNSSLSWQEIYSRILPEDRKLFQQVMQKAIQSLGRLDNEYRIRDVSGRIRWINSRGQVSPLENGSVIIEGVALDITERRQAQADLQALVEGAAAVTGKDLFSLLLEYIASFLNVRCALIVTRNGAHFQTAAFWADGKLQNNVSGLLEKMPCYLTMTQGKFCCPQKLFQDFPDPLFSELDSYVGVAIKSTAGETLGSLCLLDNKPIVDVDRMTAILQVFAARVGAELERQQAMTALEQLNQELEIGVEERTFELRESQERWELALRGTNDGIWDWNLRTNEVFYSSRWKQMRGFADDEIGSRIQEWSNLIHDDDYNRVMNALADHLARKTPFFQEEYRVQRKDGSCMWVLDRRQALWDENGHVLRVVGSESDITIRKQTEQELRKINEQLTLTNAELQRATRLKDEFLANMSHELRTPLNAILGLSEGLQEDVFGEINPGQQKAIATIERSGRHLLELINDILDLSKIESGKLELQLALVPIKNLVDSTLPFVRQQATQKNINFSVYLPHSLGKIFVDELRIRQVLINLLNNAIKFTHEGGNVSLFLNLDGNDLVISVTDTGIGIAPEDMNKLFQPFVQLDTKLSRQYNGTGLGLSLVRRLVDLHHGTVEVTSELGKGSCFTVKLPHHQSGNDDLIRHVAFPSWNLSNLSPENNKVLIIEDTRTAAEQVQRYLDEIGMEAVVYPQGEGAIAQIISYQPALIILDIMLPHRSGWEVLAQIKAHPETCSIPVIIVSVVDERSHGLELGATEYLVKPINRQQFHQVIHQLRQPTTNLTLESQNTPEIDAPSQITQKSPLILIAEDNEANVDTISNYLESRGYRLLVAKNGVESIELTKNHHPDLILIDIQMPIMDGLEATRLIRTDQNLTNIPIIALTGLAMPGDRNKCLQAGANEYLTKPVRLKQLTTMIENLLYESRNNPQC
jgi:PAS domain S-box-containing protein